MVNASPTSRIAAIALSAQSQGRPRLVEEQKRALEELTRSSHFQPLNDNHGPYDVTLSLAESRLVMAMRNAQGEELSTLVLSLMPYKRLIQDYFLMIDSYEEARYGASCGKLEAIDVGRRGLHNEGAELLIDRLKDKIDIDFETARRLFTLICALHRSAGVAP